MCTEVIKWYVPRKATFNDTKNGIVPTATITCAENGVQATGCLDTGAVMCVMDTAKAQDMDIKPWDGHRTATAANGNSMIVHGVAHGVEVFMDGHRLEVDFLVADLGSRLTSSWATISSDTTEHMWCLRLDSCADTMPTGIDSSPRATIRTHACWTGSATVTRQYKHPRTL